MKRHYLGFEIDPKYAQLAQDRLTTKVWRQEATTTAGPIPPSDGLDEPLVVDEPISTEQPAPKPRPSTKPAAKKKNVK